MDKLQPLIKHHFWICFSLAALLTTVGWAMASGSLSEAIEARRTAVNGSFSKAKQNGGNANASWVTAVAEMNTTDESAYKNAAEDLRKRQTAARQWPASIRAEMDLIPHLQQIDDQLTREKWAAGYRDEVEALLEIVKPFRDGEGLVLVDSSRITRRDYNSWRTRAPQSSEIWNAQEDIWLLRALLTSIASVNNDAERINEASVREIIRLHLRGGDREAKPASAGAAGGMGGFGGMGGGDDKIGSMGAMGALGESGESGMGSGGGLGGASHPGKSFEGSAGGDILVEEFGAASGGTAGGMGGMSGMGSMGMSGGMGSMGMSGGMGELGGSGESGGDTAAAEEDRYVDEVENSYKTRGFLLDVRVQDQRLPELLAALTDSDFPVEIVRVEITAIGGGGGGTGGAGGMMSGYGDEGESGLGGMMGSGGMSGGSGMMSPPGLGGAGGGSSGMMSPPGMGGGKGGSGMMGAPGLGGSSGMGESGIMGDEYGGTVGQSGSGLLNAALSDQSLLQVKIGGLMTLYQSAAESEAAEATEAAGVEEGSTAKPPTIVTPEVTEDQGGDAAADPAADTTETGAESVPANTDSADESNSGDNAVGDPTGSASAGSDSGTQGESAAGVPADTSPQ